jgi:hypothetical protein
MVFILQMKTILFGSKDHIIYKDKSNKYPTGKQKVNFIHVIQNGETTEYRILQQEVNITENQLAKDTSFTGDIAGNIIYNAEKGVQQTITASNCKPQPIDKGELYPTITDPQGKYEIKVFKNKDGKLNVEFKLLTPSKKGLSEDDKTKIEAQTQELMNEKLQELGWEGKSSDAVSPTPTEDGGEFMVKEMNGKQWLETLGDLGTNVWENAALPESYWNKDKGYGKSNIHIPPTFAGVGDGVIGEVSDYPQLIKLGYDVSTNSETREGIWKSVKNVNFGSVRAMASDAIKDEIDGWNFTDKPWEGYHKLGQRGVQVASFALGGFIKKGAKGALEEGVNDTGKKFFKKIDSELDKLWQLSKQKLGRAHSSKILGENLEAVGKIRPANSAAHHIVAGGSEKAKETRKLLEEADIDINEAANGVFLPKSSKYVVDEATPHANVHTNKYFDEVNIRLERIPVNQRRNELQKIATELENGTFPY